MVREKIREDIAQETMVMGYEEAIERGAIAFFEDKYTAEVRMVEYCESRGHGAEEGHAHTPECYSRELCGGTHLHSTGQVGAFQIVSDSSIGAGLRRIEAVTGPEAERYIDERLDELDELAQHFKVPANEVGGRVQALEEQLVAERKRLEEVAAQASAGAADDLLDAAEEIDGIHVVVARVEVDTADALRPMADRLRERLGPAFVALAAGIDGRPIFLAAATDDAVERGLRADEIVRIAAEITGGGGGGRPQMAQAGGRDLGKLDEALDAAREAARERLSS
jgi:alanyl-tRNA synthetase